MTAIALPSSLKPDWTSPLRSSIALKGNMEDNHRRTAVLTQVRDFLSSKGPEIDDCAGVREEAARLFRIMDGTPRTLSCAALDTGSMTAFAVAALLRHLSTNNFLLHGTDFPEDLIWQDPDPSSGQRPFSRQSFFETLCETGAINIDMMDRRSLKPLHSTPTMHEVTGIVAAWNGLQREEIVPESRRREIVRTRFQLFWILRNVSLMSLTRIGGLLSRDHSTVLSGLNQVRIAMRQDIGVAREIRALCEITDRIGVARSFCLARNLGSADRGT